MGNTISRGDKKTNGGGEREGQRKNERREGGECACC